MGRKVGGRPRSKRPDGPRDRVSSFWLWFSLLDLTENQTRLGGDVGEANSSDLAKPGRHWRGPFWERGLAPSSPVPVAFRTEAELLQPSSSPFLLRVHTLHTPLVCGASGRREPGAARGRKWPGPERWQESTLGFGRVRSPQRSLRQTSRWIPLYILFLINVPENWVYRESPFGHSQKRNMFGLLSLVFKLIFIYLVMV